MRTLSTTLLAEQRKATATPYLRVALTKSGQTSYTFATNDATNRLLSVWQREAPVVAGDDVTAIVRGLPVIQGIPISAIIRIRDESNTYVAIDLRGYKAVIGWGFMISASPERSDNAEVKVVSQRNVSEEGGLVVELYCMDKFAELELFRVIGGYAQLNGTPSGTFTAAETVTGGTSGATGVFSSQNAGYIQLHTIKGSFENGEVATGNTSNETLTITSIEFVGVLGPAPTYDRDVTTLQILGAMHSGICELKDDTDSALAATLYLSYSPLIEDIRSNDTLGQIIRRVLGMALCGLRPRWDTTNSDTYMRLIYLNTSKQAKLNGTPSGTFTAGETVTQAVSGATGRFVYQNTASIIIEAQTGTFNITNLVTGGDSTETITPTSIEAYDYEYDTAHAHWSVLEGVSCVVPNRIIYVDKFPSEGAAATYSGTAEDTTSVGDIGYVTAMFADTTIQGNTEAASRAAAKLIHTQMQSYQGVIAVPMNCGQEILDYVKVTDTRAGSNVVVGWIGELIRYFDPSNPDNARRFGMEITIGTVKPEEIHLAPGAVSAWDQLILLFDGATDTPGTDYLLPVTMVPWRKLGSSFYDVFAIAFGNYIYVGGGHLTTTYTKLFSRYHITNKTWEKMADLPETCQTLHWSKSSGENNGKIYFVATHKHTYNGSWSVDWWKHIIEYTIATDTWVDMGAYPTVTGTLAELVVVCCSDALYLHQSGSSGQRFDKMNYATKAWTSLTSVGARCQVGGKIGDEVYVVLRDSPFETYLYNKAGDSWADQSQDAPAGSQGGCFIEDEDEIWMADTYVVSNIDVYKYTTAGGWVSQFTYARVSYAWDFILQPTGMDGFYALFGTSQEYTATENVAAGSIHEYVDENVWDLGAFDFNIGDIIQIDCDIGIPVQVEKDGALISEGRTFHLVLEAGTYQFTLSKIYDYTTVKIHRLVLS